MKWVVLSLSLIWSAKSTAGSCTSQSLAALNMCKSKSFISEADPKGDFVTKNFRPTNDRMSPESCQGFSDAYNRYKNLTENYISSCEESLQMADEACRSIDISSKSDILDVTGGIQIRDQAKTSRGHLEALKPPMDRMKKQLDDCLRETGGRIVNTNKDRGNADMDGKPETLAEEQAAQSAGQDSPNRAHSKGWQYNTSQVTAASVAARDPNADHRIPTLAWGNPQASKSQQAALKAELKAYEQAAAAKQATAWHMTTQKNIRGPASVSRDGKARDGITGPESNLFRKIHLRYKAQTFSY